jgi:DNA topoisomerase-1
LELLAQPKTGGKRARGKAAAIRTLGNSPVTGTPIEIKDGKYGIYVTDGTTNATLPKPVDPGALTLPQALELLAARAALGPAKKKRSPGRKKP